MKNRHDFAERQTRLRPFRNAAALFLLLAAVAAQDLPTTVIDWTTVSRERSFDGAVEAERRSTVSSQVAARIEELPFDVDDYVERGDIIVRFRNLPASASTSCTARPAWRSRS